MIRRNNKSLVSAVLLVFILSLILTGCGQTAFSPKNPEETEIANAATKYVTGYYTYDYKTFPNHKDTFISLLTPGYKQETEDALSKLAPATKSAKENQKAQDVRITSLTISADTATAAFAYVGAGDYDGREFQVKYKGTVELKKIDGKWLVNKAERVEED